jgi:hypothetical protein
MELPGMSQFRRVSFYLINIYVEEMACYNMFGAIIAHN